MPLPLRYSRVNVVLFSGKISEIHIGFIELGVPKVGPGRKIQIALTRNQK